MILKLDKKLSNIHSQMWKVIEREITEYRVQYKLG